MNNKHSTDKIDFNYIIDGIYIGTNQCCQIDFDKELVQKGVKADISMEEERVDAPFGVDFYLWIPVKNHTAPTPDQLDLGVATLEKIVAMQRKVYVHCKNGHGRAPTLVVAYLIRKNGKTVEEAISFVQSKRSSIHLNEAQRAALQDFSRKN